MKQLKRLGILSALLLLAAAGWADNITATWDFTNTGVAAEITALSGSEKAGTVKAIEDNGILLTVEANGREITANGNGILAADSVVFKVPVQSVNDTVTVDSLAAAKIVRTATADEVEQGYVTIVSKGQTLASISVQQVIPEPEDPMLATLTINDVEWPVETLFGDKLETTIEISNLEEMVGGKNPVKAKAAIGEVGTITYKGDDKACVVTIPVTNGEKTVQYVLTVTKRPGVTLTYYDTDGKTILGEVVHDQGWEIGTFDIDYTTATAQEGYKVRGWFVSPEGGKKYTTQTEVFGDINLFAVATEIEEASTYKRYTFDLTDPNFDPADHEAFTPRGSFHPNGTHGYAFGYGSKIDLLVGPKATISVTLCSYGEEDDNIVHSIIVTDANDKTIDSIPGISRNGIDGEVVSFNYRGESGTITLNMRCTREMYIHAVQIVNTYDANYENEGNWYFVKPGDASSLKSALNAVNELNAQTTAERVFVYLPAGEYDLGEAANTIISGHNISIIGQSMDNTIIKTTPDWSAVGLDTGGLLHNTASGLYLQDLTLQNAVDYYSGLNAGIDDCAAAALLDAGNRTIGKRVRLRSHQNTYYGSNTGMQSYWEDCDIHGNVNFISGGGDVRFQSTTLSLESREADGTGLRTIAAPCTTTSYGFVFEGCKVADLAEGSGTWSLGQTWQNKAICIYLDTTLDPNAEQTLIDTRWTEVGINGRDPQIFGEFHTMDIDGNDITPELNNITTNLSSFQTILSASMAARFSYTKMFSGNTATPWDPATLTIQVQAPADARFDNGFINWSETRGAIAYALFRDGVLEGIAEGSSYYIDSGARNSLLTIRSINAMGGLGPAGVISGTDAIATHHAKAGQEAVYTLQGVRVSRPGKGIYIIGGKKTVIK